MPNLTENTRTFKLAGRQSQAPDKEKLACTPEQEGAFSGPVRKCVTDVLRVV